MNPPVDIHKSSDHPIISIRYQIERRIFQELLDLKRLQIRTGRANEQVLVKRLADEYTKNITTIVGLRKHDGPFTFKDYEKYLYGRLPFLLHSSTTCQTDLDVTLLLLNEGFETG